MDTQSQYQVFLPSFGEPFLSVDLPSAGPFSLQADPPPCVTQHTSKKQKNELAQDERRRDATTIDKFPENVLLEIFDISQKSNGNSPVWVVWKWHILVHVCKRWRQIVFASPLCLNLRIFCTYGTSVRMNLGIWPPLPIVLMYHNNLAPGHSLAPDDEGDVIAALEHPGLVSYIALQVTGSQLGKIATEMREPFPELTVLHLNITSLDRNTPVLSAEFLGGSAPRLQQIILRGIPFPALPTLLLSASDLTSIALHDIPPTGYISPEAMAAGLAALPRLKTFIIKFSLGTPHPDQISPPPATRTVLPSLTTLIFYGASAYLEDLVGRIDSPKLETIAITYVNQLFDFHVAQLSNFVNRSVGPKLALFRQANVDFRNDRVIFEVPLRRRVNNQAQYWPPAKTDIRCGEIDWQVFHMAQVLTQFTATLSNLHHLELTAELQDSSSEAVGEAEWPHLLNQFTALKTLHVLQELAKYVALALDNITGTGGVFEGALPSLDLIYLEGQPASSVEKFVAVRQRIGHPVTVIDTKAEFKKRLDSYVRE